MPAFVRSFRQVRLIGMKRATLATLAVFAGATLQVQAASAPPGLESYITKAMHDWGVPGLAIAVVKGDEVVYAHGFGVQSLDSKDSVTPDTIFGIGSVTKSFTATSLAMLVDDGKVSWDAPVRNYVLW